MTQWVILHNGSVFSQVLGDVLGRQASIVSIESLVMHTEVYLDVCDKTKSYWKVGKTRLDGLSSKIMFQEGFYVLGDTLHSYYPEDRPYVQASWQSLLLSVFEQMKRVINPVSPQLLSISTFQIPRIYRLASHVGLSVPSYEFISSNQALCQSSLWYSPLLDHGRDQIKIDAPEGSLVVVCFSRMHGDCYQFWPDIPPKVRSQLRLLCLELQIDVGEAYFYMGRSWVFYGIRPGIFYEKSEKVLEEMSICIKNYGSTIAGVE